MEKFSVYAEKFSVYTERFSIYTEKPSIEFFPIVAVFSLETRIVCE